MARQFTIWLAYTLAAGKYCALYLALAVHWPSRMAHPSKLTPKQVPENYGESGVYGSGVPSIHIEDAGGLRIGQIDRQVPCRSTFRMSLRRARTAGHKRGPACGRTPWPPPEPRPKPLLRTLVWNSARASSSGAGLFAGMQIGVRILQLVPEEL